MLDAALSLTLGDGTHADDDTGTPAGPAPKGTKAPRGPAGRVMKACYARPNNADALTGTFGGGRMAGGVR